MAAGSAGTLKVRDSVSTRSLLRASMDAGRYTTWTPVNFSVSKLHGLWDVDSQRKVLLS